MRNDGVYRNDEIEVRYNRGSVEKSANISAIWTMRGVHRAPRVRRARSFCTLTTVAPVFRSGNKAPSSIDRSSSRLCAALPDHASQLGTNASSEPRPPLSRLFGGAVDKASAGMVSARLESKWQTEQGTMQIEFRQRFARSRLAKRRRLAIKSRRRLSTSRLRGRLARQQEVHNDKLNRIAEPLLAMQEDCFAVDCFPTPNRLPEISFCDASVSYFQRHSYSANAGEIAGQQAQGGRVQCASG